MTDYYYPIPYGKIYGVALQIRNNGPEVSGVYSDAGLFLEYDANKARYPLITAGSSDLLTISANSTINISKEFPQPLEAFTMGRLVLDTTSIPSACHVTPILLLDREA